MTNKLTVAYVGGFGRCGSTLIELCLGALPDVVVLGELTHLWERGLRDDELCGCGVSFSQCPFWKELGERAFGGWGSIDLEGVLGLKHRVDRHRYVPRLLRPNPETTFLHAVREYDSLYRRIYQAACDMTGARIAVDSSKHPSMAACLRHDDQIDLRIVHVMCDSRGVAHSWSKVVKRPEASGQVSYMPRYSAAKASSLWLAHNGMFEAMALAGASRLPVRYEDFVADPVATIARIAAYIGAPPPDRSVAGSDYVMLQPMHTVAGNPMRFRSGRVEVRADEAWRTSLSPARRQLVSALTLPLRVRYHYLTR